jgi:GMP synthase-like glutamine amidotransferase
MDITEDELRELRKAALRAFKEVEKSLKEEPSTIIVSGSETGESESLINDISSWLFRREENGSSSH